jgi:putative transposase
MRTAIRARPVLRPPRSFTPSPRWGGARAGAGRPRLQAIASEPHKQRPVLAAGDPVVVIARVVRGVGDLRRARALGAVSRVALARDRSDFRIVDVSVTGQRTRGDHGLELVVEADDRIALARGMQGFQVAAARALNALVPRRGRVFADRYKIVRRRR